MNLSFEELLNLHPAQGQLLAEQKKRAQAELKKFKDDNEAVILEYLRLNQAVEDLDVQIASNELA